MELDLGIARYAQATKDAQDEIKDAFKEAFGEDKDQYLKLVDLEMQRTIEPLQNAYAANIGPMANGIIYAYFCNAKKY